MATCAYDILTETNYPTDWFTDNDDGTFSVIDTRLDVLFSEATTPTGSGAHIFRFVDVPRAMVVAGITLEVDFGYETSAPVTPHDALDFSAFLSVSGNTSTRRRGAVNQAASVTPPYWTFQAAGGNPLTSTTSAEFDLDPDTTYRFRMVLAPGGGEERLDPLGLGRNEGSAPTLPAGDPLTIRIDMQARVTPSAGSNPDIHAWIGTPVLKDYLSGDPLELEGLQHCSDPCECLPYTCVPGPETASVAATGTVVEATSVDGAAPSQSTLSLTGSTSFHLCYWDSGRHTMGGPLVDTEVRTFITATVDIAEPDAILWEVTVNVHHAQIRAWSAIELWVLPDTTFDWDGGIRIGEKRVIPPGIAETEMIWRFPALADPRHARFYFRNVATQGDTLPAGGGSYPDDVIAVARLRAADDTTPINDLTTTLDEYVVVRAFSDLGTICPDPTANQPIQDEILGTGNGSNTLFYTLWPYNPASLDVEVDGEGEDADPTDWRNRKVTIDPAPGSGLVVTASYLRAEFL